MNIHTLMLYREGTYRNGVCDRACEFKNGTFVEEKKLAKNIVNIDLT